MNARYWDAVQSDHTKDKMIVTFDDDLTKEYPLVFLSREQAFKKLKQARCKTKLYPHHRNYELEGFLDEYCKFGHVINEECPANGTFTIYFSIRKRRNGKEQPDIEMLFSLTGFNK